ncbi:MAG TPA: zf-HC2 domain-containing protein [Mycobacteriales bacterium]|nr:zf-HC2 domain-containing protein [Mycobacteriales bacterium]
MTLHLGGALTAFVDGELDHERRDEVLVHLAHCAPCRGDLELLRGLKAALRAEPMAAPSDLAARLLALSAAPGQPALVTRPSGRTRGRPEHLRARRTALGMGVLALGVGGALVVAGPPPAGPVAPMDPASAGLVLEHTSTANEVPFAGTDAVPVANSLPSR